MQHAQIQIEFKQKLKMFSSTGHAKFPGVGPRFRLSDFIVILDKVF